MYKSLLISLLAVLMFGGCVSEEKAVRTAALGYLDAMANYRVDDAMPFCTQETQNGVLVTARSLVEGVDTSYILSDTPASVEITHVDMIDDTSAVIFFHKTTPIKSQHGTLDVVKRNGQWLAHIDMPVQQEQPKIKIDTVKVNGKEMHLAPMPTRKKRTTTEE